MADKNPSQDQDWARAQIEAYRQVSPRYARAAQVLQLVLEQATQQLGAQAIIQTRPKTIPSFAEKAIRKKKAGRYSDPLTRMTDLCGARVITQTLDEVRSVAAFIETHFSVDAENSVDVSQRLKPSEFGYRSIHYIVQFQRGAFPCAPVPVEIPEELYPDAACPMKAEIQVRTLLEHAWAGFVHDRVYKGAFTIPAKWERELAVLAGMLEQTDQSFARIQSGLRTYAASYGAYLNDDQLKEESEILEAVLSCDPGNAPLAHRIGQLAMELGDWPKAIQVFTRYVESGYPPIQRDLGVVLCKLNAADPGGQAYRRGQKYLELASAPPNRDADALASLAGTWKSLDEARARQYYRQAFELDPTDPYALGNTLVYEIVRAGDLAPAGLMAPSLRAALQRCRDQADVGMNLPWAFYNLGLFHLLGGQPYASLSMYARALQLSTNDWEAETSLRLLERLAVVQAGLRGYEWVRTLLLLGRAVLFHDPGCVEAIRRLASPGGAGLTAPVVILAGGTRADVALEPYAPVVLAGLQGFRGTLIGGGTTAAIGALVGRLQEQNPGSVTSHGYVPGSLPQETGLDPRYSQIHATDGKEFSALEPLQYWIDLVASGISPERVKLIGINGGEISACEYRLALLFSSGVGIFAGSGREADTLLKDPDWAGSKTLFRLPPDPAAVRAFAQPAD